MFIPMSTGLVQGGAASLEFVGQYDLAITTSTSRTLTFDGNLTGGTDANVQEGDLVLVFACNDWNRVYITPSGWSTAGKAQGNDTYDAGLEVFYKVMTVTPDTSVTVDFDINRRCALGCVVFRNIDTAAPLDATPALAQGSNSGLPNPQSITKNDSNAVVFTVGAGAGTPDFSGRAMGDFTSSDLDNFVTDSTGYLAFGYGHSFTDTDPAQFGGGGDVSNLKSWAAITMSIAPG